MQVKLNFKEARYLKEMLGSLDVNALEGLNKFENTNGISITNDINGLEINVNPEYFNDVMKTYGKFLGIAIHQLKSLAITFKGYVTEISELTEKYSKKLPKENKSDNPEKENNTGSYF